MIRSRPASPNWVWSCGCCRQTWTRRWRSGRSRSTSSSGTARAWPAWPTTCTCSPGNGTQKSRRPLIFLTYGVRQQRRWGDDDSLWQRHSSASQRALCRLRVAVSFVSVCVTDSSEGRGCWKQRWIYFIRRRYVHLSPCPLSTQRPADWQVTWKYSSTSLTHTHEVCDPVNWCHWAIAHRHLWSRGLKKNKKKKHQQRLIPFWLSAGDKRRGTSEGKGLGSDKKKKSAFRRELC